jgi:hypothetical protein
MKLELKALKEEGWHPNFSSSSSLRCRGKSGKRELKGFNVFSTLGNSSGNFSFEEQQQLGGTCCCSF